MMKPNLSSADRPPAPAGALHAAPNDDDVGGSQTAENVCPGCAGSGRAADGSACPTCDGSGTVIEPVGDA